MVLQDLFDTLATGEFAHLSLANSVTGSIKEESYPRIVTALNRSLTEVYKRFLLKEKKVNIVQQEGLSRYYLRSKYLGFSGATSSEAYLLDHEEEIFNNDVIRIMAITDNAGIPVKVNPPYTCNEETFFRTKQFDTLDLVTEKTGQIFTIEYQASYPKITIDEEFDPDTYQLYYPPFIEDALINLIASILIKGKTTKASEGEGYASNSFMAKYELSCLRILELGLTEEFYTEDVRFNRRGFV